MSVDPEVSNWVLEFLFRQPLEDRALNSLLRSLPLPDNKPTLTKSILLKKLEFDASRDSVSESTLDALEQLEEIEFRQGVQQVSDSMKRAYWAVAVDCTLRVLANGDDGESKRDTGDVYRRFQFFENVVKIWRRRIRLLEKEGLGSDDLWIWKEEIEAAVWDDNALVSIKKKWEGVNAAEAVKDYVSEEREKLAPSFLEVLVDRMKGDEFSWGIPGMRSLDQRSGKEAPLDNFVLKKNVSDVNNEIGKEQLHPGKRHVGSDFEGLVSRNSKRAKTVDSEKMTTIRSMSLVARENKCDDPVEADCVEARSDVAKDSEHHDPLEDNHVEASSDVAKDSWHHDPMEDNHVKASSDVAKDSGHHDHVEDDHVKASSDVAEHSGHHDLVEDNHVKAIPDISRKIKCLDPVQEKHVEVNLFNVGGTGDLQTNGCGAKDKIDKPSVMEANTFVPNHERGDPITRPQDDLKDLQARDWSRSPRRNASPLKKPENKVLLRRRAKRWSLLEEDTLRNAVQKYGKGNWKFLLSAYQDIFVERTDVDLKDKWRNMSRYMS